MQLRPFSEKADVIPRGRRQCGLPAIPLWAEIAFGGFPTGADIRASVVEALSDTNLPFDPDGLVLSQRLVFRGQRVGRSLAEQQVQGRRAAIVAEYVVGYSRHMGARGYEDISIRD